MNSTYKTLHLIVCGRVQGVGFRYATQRKAFELGVVGWVRNTPEGNVEVEAQGTEERISGLLAFCQQGPPSAQVTEVKILTEGEIPAVQYNEFSIRG